MKDRLSAQVRLRKRAHRAFSTSLVRPEAVATPFWQARDSALNHESTRVAVLGGGITGLTYAYLVSKIAPRAHIDVFDRAPRLGGWLQSSSVNVNGQDVIFEHGPRSLRPTLTAAGMATMDLIRDLKLQEDVISTPKDSPAARNRFVYFPDGLAHMPDPRSGITELLRDLRQPVFKGSILPVASEFARPQRTPGLMDESIGSFFRRRFSAPMADNLVSAMIHGIYAGNVEELSIKSIMPALWYQECSNGGLTRSTLRNWRKGRRWQTPQDFQLLLELCRKQRQDLETTSMTGDGVLPTFFNSSIYTFKHGLERLAIALRTALEMAENVALHPNCAITGLKGTSHSKNLKASTVDGIVTRTNNMKIEVSSQRPNEEQQKQAFTHVASALPSDGLLSACEAANTISQQEALHYIVPSVTVMVVNLYYKESDLLPRKGFGYLIPRSVSEENNPDRVLGVVFDSDATPDIDTALGTKLTVMIGGHWWNGCEKFPTVDEGIAISKALLDRHLGINVPPLAAKATLQKDCIPQYVVGHQERYQALHELLNSRLGGSLELLGASWNGVSVNDCIKDAYLAAQRFQYGKAPERRSSTGWAQEFSKVSEIISM